MDGIFDEEFEAQSQNTELEKALEAGYGTDAASFTQGRSLQREDLDQTMLVLFLGPWL